jgi:pyruvate formate lyase activating enzyme
VNGELITRAGPAEPAVPGGTSPARYLLPDYRKLLSSGSLQLGVAPATDLESALDVLLAAYRAIPQRHGTALALGRLDELLRPFVTGPDEADTATLRAFWAKLATLPGPGFATVGPSPGPIADTLIRITDAVPPRPLSPRLVLRVDPGAADDPLLETALTAVVPPLLADDGARPHGVGPDYALVDSGIRLPVGGGAFGLVRIDLVSSVLQHRGGVEEYLDRTLPEQLSLFVGVLATRTARASSDPASLDLGWPEREGLVHRDRFGAVVTVTGLAEALIRLSGSSVVDPELIARTRDRITEVVAGIAMPHCRIGGGRAWLSLPSGRPALAETGREQAISGAAEMVPVPSGAPTATAVGTVRQALAAGASLCIAADQRGSRRVTGFMARDRVGPAEDRGPLDGGYLSGTVQRSMVDGPGQRYVVFLQGCPYDCLSCHNPCSIPIAPPGMARVSVDEVVAGIRAHAGDIDGVTVSGGEATGQPRFVRDLFLALSKDPATAHLTRFVDSNGHTTPEVWQMLAPVTDGVMLDLKALDEQMHIIITGQSRDLCLSSIRTVAGLGLLHEVRLLLLPGLNDDDAVLKATAEWLNQAAPGVRVVVNPFRHEGTRACARDLAEPRPEDLDRYARVLTQAGLTRLVVPEPA